MAVTKQREKAANQTRDTMKQEQSGPLQSPGHENDEASIKRLRSLNQALMNLNEEKQRLMRDNRTLKKELEKYSDEKKDVDQWAGTL